MTSIGLALLLLLTGYLLSTRLVREADPVERAAYTLLFSMSAVPLVVIIICLAARMYTSAGLVAAVAVALLLFMSRHAVAHLRGLRLTRPPWQDLAVLGLGLAVAAGAYLHFSRAEVLWSLHSYLLTDKASCFPMQLYRLVEGLNPGVDPARVRGMYSIISTPGNALFPVGTAPIFGVHTFHALYVLFSVTLYLFTYLLVRGITGRRLPAVVAALFAVANPYWLSVETLDRNAIALALSAALFHALFFRRDSGHALLHGLLLGLVAGTGLRFIPLTFGLSVLLCYAHRRARPRDYLIMAGACAAVFVFNLPHLSHHGFHSLGEQRSFFTLAAAALDGPARTPFMPYPNWIYYPLTTLSHLGLLASALALLGAVQLWRQDRLRAAALLLMFPLPFVALAVQPDWIQVDKARIFISLMLPLLLFAGVGLAALLERERLLKNVALLAACLGATALIGLGMGRTGGAPDSGMHRRKPMYQTEAEPYIQHYRAHFAPLGVLPGYGRLFRKIDPARKRLDERVIAHSLFAGAGNPKVSGNRWVKRWLRPDSLTLPAKARLAESYVNLRIDLERLVSGGGEAVTVPSKPGELFVNLEKREDLLDIYYRAVRVSWQPQPLPVAVLTGKPELPLLGELAMDLNAFISLGQDEDGFERVNVISNMYSPERRARGKRSGMTALPNRDRSTAITVRVPAGGAVLIRNWLVDSVQGVSHRVDAWEITLDGGKPEVRFYPHEPESYF